MRRGRTPQLGVFILSNFHLLKSEEGVHLQQQKVLMFAQIGCVFSVQAMPLKKAFQCQGTSMGIH